ncbi:MAG: dTDP-glucose 46-dehydratase [Bacillales bacterium]|nr:dTDP-glucose 46-dehydratase [Bacillales bacterium]
MRSFEKQIRETVKSWGLHPELHGRSVLITGAGGHLGSTLSKFLLAYNEMNDLKNESSIKVISAARDCTRIQHLYTTFLNDPNHTFLDFEVTSSLENLQNVDYIIHAASPSSPVFHQLNPIETLDANIIGTRNLLEFAAKGCHSFLYISSTGVYGKPGTAANAGSNESAFEGISPTEVGACYIEAKRAGEALCVAYARQKSVPAKIARLSHVFGPGMNLDTKMAQADFVSDILKGDAPKLNGDGKAVRSFLYIMDAVLGCLHVLLHGKPAEAYNVADPSNSMTIGAFAHQLVEIFSDRNLKGIDSLPQKQNLDCQKYYGIEKLASLGWKPQTIFRDAVVDTVHYYENQSKVD